MAYITDEELAQHSAIPADALATMDADVLSAHRESGTSKINGYLAGRYGDRLPLTNPPADIKQANADISGYTLMSKYGYLPEGSDSDFRHRHDDAIAWLKDVSRGLATIDLGASPATTAPYRIARVVSREPRGWDRFR